MKTILMFAVLSFATAAFADSPRIVECTSNVNGKDHKLQVRFSKDGKYKMWNTKHVGNTKDDDVFYMFKETSVDYEGILEYASTETSPAGYSVLKIGSTADETLIAIKPDLSKAYWRYTDCGSGNGNQFGRMSCVEVKP